MSNSPASWATEPSGRLESMMTESEKALDPRRLSPNAAVRFQVRPIESARLVWLNRRWFLEHGMDVTSSEVRDTLERELLGKFGVIATTDEDTDTDTETGRPWLEADLYGGTGGALHGGSGRCGMSGACNAKGIGKTPLVSETVDELHRSGFLSLKEAVREAIASEICNAELPYGAVPILAIIDTGFSYSSSPAEPGDRCAIVVRPNFVRPAHLERSIFFGEAGTADSHQFIDACRVKDVVRTIEQRRDLYPSVQEMFIRLARQLGACRSRRLWQGRFLSSNLSIDGALVDFGAFRAVPSWRRHIGLAGEAFGTEVKQLQLAFSSVLYYFARYAQSEELEFDFSDLYRDLTRIENDAFLETCLDGLGVPVDQYGKQPFLCELLSLFYQQQQAMAVGDGVDFLPCPLYELLSQDHKSTTTGAGQNELAAKVLDELTRLEKLGFPVSKSRTLAFFEPRRNLNYAVSTEAVTWLEGQLANCPNPETAIERFIETQYAAALRASPALPPELEILEMATDIASSVLICSNLTIGELALHVEGPVLGEGLFVFGAVLDATEFNVTRLESSGSRGFFRSAVSGFTAAHSFLSDHGLDLTAHMRPFAVADVNDVERAA